MNSRRFPKLCNDKTCTGCGACENVCPAEAIILSENDEGFLIPHVNENSCIGCLKCEKLCPVLSYDGKENDISNFKTYASWNNDENIRKESSSGGIFSALAEKVITFGGN